MEYTGIVILTYQVDRYRYFLLIAIELFFLPSLTDPILPRQTLKNVFISS